MATKKTKLPGSLNASKSKSAVAKRKALPKLKVILANPYQSKSKVLDEGEVTELIDVINKEINKSGLSGKEFARESNFCLSLGSSLRVINEKQASCVLISQSIKPKFIIDQIAYLTNKKSTTAPVHVIANLETISTSLFGIKAVVVVLPLKIPAKLSEWISMRSQPRKEEKSKQKDDLLDLTSISKSNQIDLCGIYLAKEKNGGRAFVPETVVKYEIPMEETRTEEWTGDYISFSKPVEKTNKMCVDEEDFEKQKDKVLTVLQKMTTSMLVLGQSKPDQNIMTTSNQSVSAKRNEVVDEEEDSDHFLDSYVGLTVHKIQPNPQKKKKPKRKAKKRKQDEDS